MKILIAEDEPVSREKLETLLRAWGHEVTSTRNGDEAWQVLQRDDGPALVVSDVQMPGMTGPELCRQARAHFHQRALYIILLTATRVTKSDLVDGLLAGADDYLLKPADPTELEARLKVGERVLRLQNELGDRVKELEEALGQIKQLQGMLPICAYCKKIRDDKNYWHQVEEYVTIHTSARFTHGICPACLAKEQLEMEK